MRDYISFSTYRLFSSCAFKYHLLKDLNYAEGSNEFLIFGTAIHATIEDIVNKKHSHILYEGLLKKHLAAGGGEVFANSYFGKKMLPEGVAILKELDILNRYKGWEIVGSEIEMYEPLFEETNQIIYFKGIIDLVLKQGDKYIIIDFKTAMKPWDIEKKKEDKGFFGQLALYKHFFAVKNGIDPKNISTRFVALARVPINIQQYEINISQEFSDDILADIKRVAKEIGTSTVGIAPKAKHSGRADASYTCNYCPFKGICTNQVNQVVLPKEETIKND
jgi:hypothetical protein